MKTDREICAAATDGPWFEEENPIRCLENTIHIKHTGVNPYLCFDASIADGKFIARFNPQKVMQILDRQEQLEAKLKEASEFIQKLGPTIDYDIVSEIEELLGE